MSNIPEKSSSTAIVFDTETTGLDGDLIQAGVLMFHDAASMKNGYTSYCQNYKPSKPIEAGAMATHNIIEEDLIDCPPSSSFKLPDGVEYLIGHNIDFDHKVIGSPSGYKRIDTLAIARKLFPNDSHKLSALVYLLHDDKKEARRMVQAAHNAKADVEMTFWILMQMMRLVPTPITSFESLWQYSEACRIPDVMTFGKHKGELITTLPKNYVTWLIAQPELDPYLEIALRRIL